MNDKTFEIWKETVAIADNKVLHNHMDAIDSEFRFSNSQLVRQFRRNLSSSKLFVGRISLYAELYQALTEWVWVVDEEIARRGKDLFFPERAA